MFFLSLIKMNRTLSKYIYLLLKGHGHEADFLWFLHKPVRHVVDSPTRRVGESPSRGVAESGSRFSITNISANSKPKSERLER